MNDLDLLREWRVPAPPTADVRAQSLAELEALFYAPTTPLRPRAPRRRLATRVAVALAVTLALVAGAVIWAQRQADRRFDAVGRIHLPKGTLSGAAGGKVPVTILVVGSDSRAGLNDPAFGNSTDLPGERADTMILLRITRDGAAALWVPRDIVDVTGSSKLNAGLNFGPERLIAGLNAKLGVTIDRYVAVRFRGFERIVDALGGVRLNVPYPAPRRDERARRPGRGLHVVRRDTGAAVRPLPEARVPAERRLGAGRPGSRHRPHRPAAAPRRRHRGQGSAHARGSSPRVAPVRRRDAPEPADGLGHGVAPISFGSARTLLGLDPHSLQTVTLPWKTGTATGGQAVLDLADGSGDFARQLTAARTASQLRAVLGQPVTASPASADCR